MSLLQSPAAWERAAMVDLEARFPGAVVWYGQKTGSWWAMVRRGRWRLVEASDPTELARTLRDAAVWSWPR